LRRLVSSRRYHPFLLSFGHGRLRHIVLGDFIRTSVIERFPSLRTSLYAIRIPGFFEEATPPSRLSLTKPITFSFLGLIDEMKGFDDFARLAETIGPSYNGAARFDLVGGTRVGSLPVINEWVHTYSSNGPMPRDVFDAQLRLTTYAVFPYDQWFYRYIASASVLDALNAGKPLIALRSPQFEELFQAMGDIGYLCDDFNEMKSVVASILRDPPHKRYEEQSQNILTGRRIFEPSSVATQLRAALLAG